jgi:hypothetical protein
LLYIPAAGVALAVPRTAARRATEVMIPA